MSSIRTLALSTVCSYIALSVLTQATPPRLLPFQGRLTDANGAPVADGTKVVQFKIYDAPTGGNAVWPGEVQKLSVNGGLVSTLLGSKADLSAVDFNQALYLEITVDANSDQQITQADPPLLPRQSILPAIFAVEAQTAKDSSRLAGLDWSAVFDNGNPGTGKIPGSKLALGSVGGLQIAPDAISTAQIVDGSVGSADLAPGAIVSGKIGPAAVVSANLQAGSVTQDKRADLVAPVSATAVRGEAARCNVIATFNTTSGTSTLVTGSNITLAKGNRPVRLEFSGGTTVRFSPSPVDTAGRSAMALRFMRRSLPGGTATLISELTTQANGVSDQLHPSGAYWCTDFSPAGTYEYWLEIRVDKDATGNGRGTAFLYDFQLIGYEL